MARRRTRYNGQGKKVIDEMCKCGHLRSEHGDKLFFFDKIERDPNQGNCCALGCHCHCKQFKFARLVLLEEQELIAS